MKALRTTLIILIAGIISFAFYPSEKDITVYLIGDSTMADKPDSDAPETGWGMPFKLFFNESVSVENHAVNGRSSKSFLYEGRWEPVVNNLKEGDYVFIQFGHNDEFESKGERYSPPEEFKANLTKYVNETREKNATPILITPVTRRHFDENGNIEKTHPHSHLVVEVANELEVPLIDLDAKSRELVQEFGPEYSKMLYMHLEPGEHPNYPKGKEDDTHFNELGARLMAQIVLKEIKKLDIGLNERVVNADK